MFYPNLTVYGNTKDMTNAFLGLDRGEVIGQGEIYDMRNLTSDYYPAMAPRHRRNVTLSLADNEWVDMQLAYTVSYVGDVAQFYAEATGSATIGERHVPHRVEARTDPKHISSCDIIIKETDDTGGSTSTTYEGASDITFTPAEDTASVSVTVRAYPADSSWDSSKVSEYLTGCTLYQLNDTVRGMLIKDGKLCYLIGSTLYYAGKSFDFSKYIPSDDHTAEVQILSFGALILIFPLDLYLNTQTEDYGSLGNKQSMAGTVNYAISDKDGDAITATESATAPENPAEGQYWLNTTTKGLYVYSINASRWETVPTTYIRITFPEKLSGFEKGDAVALNTKLSDVNEASIIQGIGDDWITVIGIMDKTTDSEDITATIERKIPKMDFVCVSNNRVWGCYAGQIDGSIMVNEIYASKLGDPKNWNVFAGLATDSYALSIGSDGAFTGAITYNGCPTFFKENVVYKIYGSYPAAYQLYTYEMRGVERGSERSLTIVGSYLAYKSVGDVIIFDGSSATPISSKLGNAHFSHAAGGSCVDKYYLSMLNDDTGKYELYVYDTVKGLWMKEEELEVRSFAYTNTGALYGQSGLKIYGFGTADDDFNLSAEQEEYVSWMAESGKLGIASPDRKRYQKIYIRALMPIKSEIRVSVAYDGKEFEPLLTLRGQGTTDSYPVNLPPQACDYMQLKLEGHGDVHIYSIAYVYRREQTT